MSDYRYRRRRDFRRPARRRRAGGGTGSPRFIPGFSRTEDEKRRGPIQTLFDWIGTPARINQNVMEDIALKRWEEPIGRAMPWREDMRRPEMENILFGGEASTGEQLPAAIHPIPDEKGGGRQILRKGFGFIGDVVTDPLTWVTLGGPTSAARAGAIKFATRAAQQSIRQMDNPMVLRKIYGDVAQRRMTGARSLGFKTNEEAVLSQQYRNQVFKDAYREALTTPTDQLKKNYLDRLGDERRRLQELIDNPPGDKKFWDRIRKRSQQQMDAVDADEAWVKNEWDSVIGNLTSERKGPIGFLGKAFTTKDRPGFIRRNIAEAGAAVRHWARENPRAKSMLDAWWARSNTGILGSIRNVLGFFNPVGKIMNQINITNKKTVFTRTRESIDEIQGMFKDVNDEQKKELVDLFLAIDDYSRVRAEQAITEGVLNKDDKDALLNFFRTTNREALQDPGVRSVVSQANQEVVFPLYADTQALKQRWFDEEQLIAAKGIIDDFDELDNYLPIAWKRRPVPGDTGARIIGAKTYTPHQVREQGTRRAVEAETLKLSTYFGFTDDQARMAVQHNLTNLQTDPQSLLQGRAQINARIHGREQVLEAVQPWGININETQHMARLSAAMPKVDDVMEYQRDNMIRMLKSTYNKNSGDLGLHRIQNGGKFFDGWLYPTEVANVISRVTDVTGKESQALFTAFKNYTRWWSNVVTLSPRYHIRNLVSNVALLFLRYGTEAFNPRLMVAAAAGAARKLETPASRLTGGAVKISGTVEQALARNWKIGDHTVDELAQEAYDRGVISKVSYAAGGLAGEASEIAQTAPKWRVGKRVQDKAFRASHNVGSVIESSQRFHGFLAGAKEMMRPGKTRLTEGEMDFVATEASKWLVDYSRLSDIERNVLRYVIPFYSWIRHNLPNMIETVGRRPALFNAALKGEKALFESYSGGIEIDSDIIPDWMLEMNYMPLSQDEQGNVVFGYTGLPWAELNVLPFSFGGPGKFGMPHFEGQRFFEEIVQRSNPILKTLIEMGMKKRTLTGQSLENLIVVPRGLHGLKSDIGLPLLQFVDGAAQLVGAENGLGFTDEWGEANLNRKGQLRMEGWAYPILENNLPTLKLMSNMLVGGVAAADRLGIVSYETLEEMDLTDPTRDRLDLLLSGMGYYLGIATTQKNIRELQKWRQIDLEKEQRARRNFSTKPIRIRE